MLSIHPDYRTFLEQLVQHAPDAMIVTDLAGKIILANQQTLRTFGYARQELLGLPVETLIPHRYREDHPRHRSDYVDNPSKRPMGLWRNVNGLHKNGTEVPVEVSLSKVPVFNATFLLASVRNVSEQRWLENTVQYGNLTLEQIAKGAPLKDVLDSIAAFVEMSCDETKCCILQHDAVQQQLLVAAAPTLSAVCRDVFDHRRIEPGIGLWSEAVFNGERMAVTELGARGLGAELGGLTAQGIRACWSEPIQDCQGKAVGTLLILAAQAREPESRETQIIGSAAHMIGIALERDRHHQELLEHEKRLRQKHKLEAIGSLTGGIAHEFNNLLQTISAYTQFALANTATNEQMHQDLTTVESAAKRATSLTRQLLSFCRRHPIEQQLISLNALVDETCNLVRPLIGENIELEIVQDSHTPEIIGDFGQLQQVIINLCINARDAMPQGGKLMIRTQAADRKAGQSPFEDGRPRAMLAVQDTGFGMTPEIKERIFEPFYTTKNPGQGTGLGLPMVYGIVQQHNGILEVDTAPKHGTTFRLYIPAADGEPGEQAPQFNLHEKVAFSNQRKCGTILIAEDEENVRNAYSRILKKAGFAVVAAPTGEEAVRLFHIHRNTLVLVMLDVVMPGKGGHRAAAIIQSQAPELPLIFCTGYNPDAAVSTETNTDVFTLVKPVQAEQLLRLVNEKLATSSKEIINKAAGGALAERILCDENFSR